MWSLWIYRKSLRLDGTSVALSIGSIRAQGDLKNYVKPGLVVGLGLGKHLMKLDDIDMRASLLVTNKAKFIARKSTQSGELTVQSLGLRSDFVYGTWVMRPVVGVGLSLNRWETNIADSSTGSSKNKTGSALGLSLTLGGEWQATDKLCVGPALSYHMIGGNFSANLFDVAVAGRWSL
jgi:opacity protein-like surface antigen